MPFSESRARHAVEWIERYCRHTKGKRFAGRPFILAPFQRQIVRDIFGTVKSDGNRQYQTAYVEIPRKNGKSELAAAIALYLLFADGEPGAEIYSAAADKKQASIVFKVAAAMVRRSPKLLKRCKIIDSSKVIVVPKTESKYEVVPADGPRVHGTNPSGVIFDECHTQKNRELGEALTTGSDTRTQPLIFAMTTAGIEGQSPLWTELHTKATSIRPLDGSRPLFDDPTFYSVIYKAPDDADWTDEEVWKQCNPAYGDFLDPEKVQAACASAKNNPLEENSFRRLRLNQKTEQENRVIPMIDWDQCTDESLDLNFARNLHMVDSISASE